MFVNETDYEHAVSTYYEALYAFGYSFAGNADNAGGLTQEAYCRLLTKGGQLRDPSRGKSWLFTTLYRVFLGWKGHKVSLVCLELENKQVAHLLVVDSAAFKDAPTDSPVFNQVGDVATASWSRGGKTYVVASKGGNQVGLMKLL